MPSAATSSTQEQEKYIPELKELVANQPEYKSVTITQKVHDTFAAEESAEASNASSGSISNTTGSAIASAAASAAEAASEAVNKEIDSVTVYKFDESGDLNKIIECIDTIDKKASGDTTTYTLNLDPAAFMKSNEYLALLADTNPIKSAVFVLTYDDKGRLVELSEKTSYDEMPVEETLTFSDFDATTIDPAPEADKTFQDMQADEEQKLDEMFSWEEEDEPANAEDASRRTPTKRLPLNKR